MEKDFFKAIDDFSAKDFKKIFRVSWINIVAGLAIYFIFVFIAFQTQKKSLPYYLIQNIGIFFFFVMLLMNYLSVFTLIRDNDQSATALDVIKKSFKKFHYLFGASAIFILALTLLVVIEGLVAYVGVIYKVGPLLLSLLTIPFFVINLGAIILLVFFVMTVPPYASGNISIRGFVPGLVSIFRESGLKSLSFSIIAIVLLSLATAVVYYIAGHALGITLSLQWNIGSFYPRIISGFGAKSFFSDIASKVAPGSEMIGLMGSYDLGLLTYGQLITSVVSVSYAVLFSVLITAPLSVFFWISSLYYAGIVKK